MGGYLARQRKGDSDPDQIANKATDKLNNAILELRRLFLVENMMDSIKFGLSLWVLTYIGR